MRIFTIFLNLSFFPHLRLLLLVGFRFRVITFAGRARVICDFWLSPLHQRHDRLATLCKVHDYFGSGPENIFAKQWRDRERRKSSQQIRIPLRHLFWTIFKFLLRFLGSRLFIKVNKSYNSFRSTSRSNFLISFTATRTSLSFSIRCRRWPSSESSCFPGCSSFVSSVLFCMSRCCTSSYL